MKKHWPVMCALVVLMGLNSCALMKKEPDSKPVSEKNVEAKLVALDDADSDNEEKTDFPSVVNRKFPNPSSTAISFAFWLPVAARTRIEICKNDGTVVSTVIDKHL